jgi:hypothetical protein
MKKEEWQAPCPSHECHASHLQDQWGLSLQGLSPKPVHLLPYPMADFTQHFQHPKSVSTKLRYYQSPSHKHTREKPVKLVLQDRVPTCCRRAEFLQICHMRNVVQDCCLHHIYTPSSHWAMKRWFRMWRSYIQLIRCKECFHTMEWCSYWEPEIQLWKYMYNTTTSIRN